MLLAVDIGNTDLTAGVLRAGKILFRARVPAARETTAEQYEQALRQALTQAPPGSMGDAIVSSVVPQTTPAVREALERITGRPPLTVSPELDYGFPILTDDPARVGSDRLVITAAALAEYPPPLVLMDLGTATNVEAVDKTGAYVGGCILPGVRTALDALTARAAQLPEISLETPGPVIGKNTVDCMRSGVLYSAAAALDGLLDRMEEELGGSVTAIATGGLAALILPLCRREIRLEPDLMLKGLELLYRKNAPVR